MPADVTAPPSPPANLEQLLQTTYNLFGFAKTLLLPLNGVKFIEDNLSGLTLDQTHQAANLWLLACYDIAARCGVHSHNLAAIRFHDETARADFLVRNPDLQGTLLTSSPNGFFVWVRIEGWYPENHEHPICDWISDKFVAVAIRQADSKYRFDNQGHPTVVSFRQIVWPADLAMHWAWKITASEYEILAEDKHGGPVVNDDFVASMFINMHANISFNPVIGTFYERLAGGRIRTHYVEEVQKSMHQVLTYIRKTAKHVAAKANGKVKLYVDSGPGHLKALTELLKILAVKPFEVPETAKVPAEEGDEQATCFEEYVLTQLEEAPGETLTVAEALAGYIEFCNNEGGARYSTRQFRDKLGDAVKREFGIGKNHDTLRNGQAKRGFRNLRLKGQDIEPRIEVCRTDRTLRTPFLTGVDWFDPGLSRNVEPKLEVIRTLGTDQAPCLPGVDWSASALVGEMATAA